MSQTSETTDRFALGEMSRQWVDLLRTAKAISTALREKDLVLSCGSVTPGIVGELSVSSSISLNLVTAEGTHFDLVPKNNGSLTCYRSYEHETGAWDLSPDGTFSIDNPLQVKHIRVDIDKDGNTPIQFLGREHAGWRRELHLPGLDTLQDYDLWPGLTEA